MAMLGRGRRAAAVVFGLVLAACALPAQAGSSAPAACPEQDGRRVCPPPRLDPPEEVLGGSVHLAWRDEHGAIRYELERRRREADAWSAWDPVGPAPTDPADAHLDDPGLAPGAYQYRVRGLYGAGSEVDAAWSAWSEPIEFALAEACAGQVPPSPRLPIVRADDRNRDGRTTGTDLELALADCSARGGCVLEALPRVYDDVAIVLYDGDPGACEPARTACLKLPFPNGLVIQGHGSATVFRSPLWTSPYHPVAVLELWKRPDIRLWVRNLVFDGRKDEQRDPTPGTNDASSWFHYGFQTWNQWGDHTRRNRNGCFHNVTVRGFMSRGISLADVADWSIDHCTIEDIGCIEGFTSCSRLGIPHGYETPGFRAAGVGLVIGWHSDDVRVEANRVRRTTKYGIDLKHGTDGSETSIRRPRVERNEIQDAGGAGIFLAGVSEGRFRANTIVSTQIPNSPPEHATYHNTFAVSCMGRVERTEFVGERWLDSAGMALNYQCAGDGNVIADALVEGSCRVRNPTTCVPGSRTACYGYADLSIGQGAGGQLGLERTQVRGTGCATPIEANAPIDLVIDGGSFASGVHAARGVGFRDANVTIQGGARFDGLDLGFWNARGVVAGSVGGRRLAYRIDETSKVLLCANQPKTCQARCAVSSPPEWCD